MNVVPNGIVEKIQLHEGAYMLCEGCGEIEVKRAASGFCRSCYKHQFKILNYRKWPIASVCGECGVAVKHRTRIGKCQPCYRRAFFQDPKRKEIAKARTKLWALQNPERVKELRRTKAIRANDRFQNARSEAKKRGIIWAIDLDWYSANIVGKICHYCHSELSGTGSSIDRKDKDTGYTPENCVPCCWPCNKIKSDVLTEQEMKIAMNAVLAFRSQKGGCHFSR